MDVSAAEPSRLSLITSPEQLPPALAGSLSADERELIGKFKTGGLPFAVTPHFASLAGPEKTDPIRRQFIPDPLESRRGSFALDDPLGANRYRITPRLIHQYLDRVLLLACGACAGFCRYCFRRVNLGASAAFISAKELEPVLAYLESRRTIREILVSGGDPLTAGDNELWELFGKLRKASPGILIRLCTRIPITNPLRITPQTVSFLTLFRPIRIVTHINHPRELSPEARIVLSSAAEAGIPVHVQTVLLRGINDDEKTLAVLFRECLSLGLSPYYLFQLDLAPGTDHFRVPLREGLALYQKLKLLVSGLALPAYVVDLPGGGGKIHLHEGAIAGEEDRPGGRVYLLKGPDGKLWEYPAG
ncbi:MAG: KamA family radical SAM protein [Treponema sp.]|nr:KamA family radical SAM protein [Treponema sp.]